MRPSPKPTLTVGEGERITKMKKMISGVDEGVRTLGLLIKSQLLYQLSYIYILAVLRDNRQPLLLLSQQAYSGSKSDAFRCIFQPHCPEPTGA